MLTPYICRRMSDEWDAVDSPSRVSPQQQNRRNVDERAKAVVSDRSLQDDDEAASNDGSDARSENDADLKPGEMSRNDQVLKILNSNVADPYIIWDNSTRFVGFRILGGITQGIPEQSFSISWTSTETPMRTLWVDFPENIYYFSFPLNRVICSEPSSNSQPTPKS